MNRFPFPWAGDRHIARGDCRSSPLPPVRATRAAGYAAPAGVQISARLRHRLGRTARQVRRNPHLMRRLNERLDALWQAEQRQQRDRDRPNLDR